MKGQNKRPMTLSLAAEEQIGGSQSLRDAMVRQALDEGHSVTDVAEALNLSPAAIYKIQSADEKSPPSEQGSAADQRAVVLALEQFSDPAGFEALVSSLIGDIDTTAIPLGGSGDRGRDAANPNSSTIFTISLQRQWKRKVESDLEKITKHGYKPERVYAVTNRRVSRKTAEELIEEVAQEGIALTILDQKWLAAKLSQFPHLHLRSGFLNLAPPRSASFLDPEQYRALLDGRPHLSGLRVHFSGRSAEVRRAAELLEAEGMVLLSGPGGYGKTRLAIELAGQDDGVWRFIDSDMAFTPESVGELPVSRRLGVVIDNAHRRDDLDLLLGALERLPIAPPRVVLVTRPFQMDKINAQIASSWIGTLDASRTVDIGPLRWRTMAQILKEPPLSIESGEQRRAIVQLAEGNPQIAVIAARVATERHSIVGMTSAELLQRYIAYLIQTAISPSGDARRQRGLLALLAALDGIGDDEEELLIDVSAILGTDTEQVKDGLEQLAESGLVIADYIDPFGAYRYRIKPDLLAEHVLFALTLTDQWELALDYGSLFRGMGKKHLLRMAKSIGALPSALFGMEEVERLYELENEVRKIVSSGDPALGARLTRELSQPRPDFAQQQALALLNRIDEVEGDARDRVIDLLREGAMRMADFPRSWRVLLRLAAACTGRLDSLKRVGDSMSETYERVPEGDRSSGAILATVQDALVAETRRFWEKRYSGAASAVALAIKPMLKVTFEVTRPSPDDPMSVELGARILPVSSHTKAVVKAGGELAAAVAIELQPVEQLNLIETCGRAAHAAAGFPLSFGRTTPLVGRILLDEALEPIDHVLAKELQKLEMPVRRAAYDFLLKRARYRRKLIENAEGDEHLSDVVTGLNPVRVPPAGEELEDFLFIINNGQVGPPEGERGTIEEDYERRRSRAKQRAEALLRASDWRTVVDCWSAWWDLRLQMEGNKATLGQAPGMVFEAIAEAEPELGAELIDHLIASESELRGASTVAMVTLIKNLPAQRWKAWLSADAVVRASLARALSNFDADIAAVPMRQLAFDEDEIVRGAAKDALVFSVDPGGWRFELCLESATRYPSVEAVDYLLHRTEEHAKEAGREHADFGPDQVALIESAILATVSLDKIESYQLADSLRLADRFSPGLVMRWVWARMEVLDSAARERKPSNLWDFDFIDEHLAPLVSEVADEEDLQRALEYFEQAEERSPVLPDIAKLIGWIDPGADEVTALMIRLLEDPELSWLVRSHLMDLPLSDEQFDERARMLASALDEPLGPLLDLLGGTLPNSWSGSYISHLEDARAKAERWAQSDQRHLRIASGEAMDTYDAQIKKWSAREEAEDRLFEYR